MSEQAYGRPKRMTLGNLSTGETLEALFNPEQFEREIAVQYARKRPLGLPHEVLQYTGTDNTKLPAIDLYARSSGDEIDRAQIEDFMRFLESLCYPPDSAQSVVQGSPPRVLFVWPNLLQLTCVVTNIRFRYQRFALDGGVTRFTASVALEEIRDVRLTSEAVRTVGGQRSPAGPSPSVWIDPRQASD